jgi:hypothetical protein
MARSNNGRPPRGTHTLGEQLEELGRQNPDMLRWMVAGMDLLRARPGATRVLMGPEGVRAGRGGREDQAIHTDPPSRDVRRAIAVETDELDDGLRLGGPGLTLPNPDAVNT